MITWAVLAPAFVVVVTLALHEIMRRYLLSPSNARKTVMAGCTAASLGLAERRAAARNSGWKSLDFLMIAEKSV